VGVIFLGVYSLFSAVCRQRGVLSACVRAVCPIWYAIKVL